MFNNLKKKIIDLFPKFQRYVHYNYGLDLSLIDEEEKDTHYIFGVSTTLIKKIIMPSGDWTKIAEQVETEKQSSPFIESMNCTVYSFLNIIEMLMLYKFNEKVNFSDRWLGIKAGTSRNGNIPTRVIDTARKQGLLLQELLPNNIEKFRWNEYFSYKDAILPPAELDKRALEFLDDNTIGYETVYPSILAMAEALKYSPLYVAGFAWAEINGIYYSASNPNHAFVILNIEQAKQYKKAFDSYEPFFKTLGRNYQIYYPKIIILNKKGAEYNIGMIKGLFDKGVRFLLRADAHGELYKVNETSIVKVEPQEFLDINIREKAAEKKLLPVNETYFNNLLL